MKFAFKNQNSRAMTRAGFLAIICGALLVLALVLHFRTARDAGSRAVSREITADVITITESRLDSLELSNVNAESNDAMTGKLQVVVFTNTAKVANDDSFSPVEMRLPPAKRQRVLFPPNVRSQPTNTTGNKQTNPGVRIAFP